MTSRNILSRQQFIRRPKTLNWY